MDESARERERDETRKIYHERRSNEETPKVRSIFSYSSFTRECVLLHLRDCKEVNNDWRGMKCQKHLESSQGFLWPTPSVSPGMEKSQKLIDTKLMGFFFFSSIRIPSLKKNKKMLRLFSFKTLRHLRRFLSFRLVHFFLFFISFFHHQAHSLLLFSNPLVSYSAIAMTSILYYLDIFKSICL